MIDAIKKILKENTDLDGRKISSIAKKIVAEIDALIEEPSNSDWSSSDEYLHDPRPKEELSTEKKRSIAVGSDTLQISQEEVEMRKRMN